MKWSTRWHQGARVSAVLPCSTGSQVDQSAVSIRGWFDRIWAWTSAQAKYLERCWLFIPTAAPGCWIPGGGLKQPLLIIQHLSILVTEHTSWHTGASCSHPQDGRRQKTPTRHMLRAALHEGHGVLQHLKTEAVVESSKKYPVSLLISLKSVQGAGWGLACVVWERKKWIRACSGWSLSASCLVGWGVV